MAREMRTQVRTIFLFAWLSNTNQRIFTEIDVTTPVTSDVPEASQCNC